MIKFVYQSQASTLPKEKCEHPETKRRVIISWKLEQCEVCGEGIIID